MATGTHLRKIDFRSAHGMLALSLAIRCITTPNPTLQPLNTLKRSQIISRKRIVGTVRCNGVINPVSLHHIKSVKCFLIGSIARARVLDQLPPGPDARQRLGYNLAVD